jgi:hypothetical protein
MLVNDGDDAAHAAPAFRLATHVPEYRRNRRPVASWPKGIAHIAV